MPGMLSPTTTDSGPAEVARDLFFAEPLILALFAGCLAVIVFFIVKKGCNREGSELDGDATAQIPVSVLTAPTDPPVSTTSSKAAGHHVGPLRTMSPRIPAHAVPPPSLAQNSGSLPESSGRAASTTPPKVVHQGTTASATTTTANLATPAASATSTVAGGSTATSTTTARSGQPCAVAQHSAPARPTPLTPPPSSGYCSSVASTATVDSAKSITPRRGTSYTKATEAQMKQMLAEQRSEDAPEVSDTGDMMAVNKMTNDDLKRMMGDRGTHRNPPMRRPQPLSAEVLTDASTQMLIPTQPMNASPRKGSCDDARKQMFSQEHVIDIQKTPSRLQSLIEPIAPPPSETNSTKDKKLSAEPLKSEPLKVEKTQPENSDNAYTPGNKEAPGKTIRKF